VDSAEGMHRYALHCSQTTPLPHSLSSLRSPCEGPDCHTFSRRTDIDDCADSVSKVERFLSLVPRLPPMDDVPAATPDATALVTHPTVNKKRSKQQFDDFVMHWLPPEFKHNAALVIAEYFCTDTVWETTRTCQAFQGKQRPTYGRHLDGKGSCPLRLKFLEDVGHDSWIAQLNRDVVLCDACVGPELGWVDRSRPFRAPPSPS
jgi:hypothetical protein